MVALSFWKTSISSVNYCIPANLRTPITLGDHIRKRRLALSMNQRDVGKIIGVSTDCVTLWENNHSFPMIHHMPRIVNFVGYNPIKIDTSDLAGQLKNYRLKFGVSLKKLGQRVGVDATTIGAWEKNGPISKKNYDKILKLLAINILRDDL